MSAARQSNAESLEKWRKRAMPYRDWGRLEGRLAAAAGPGERGRVDAAVLFREATFFDHGEAMRRKAIRLQEELNELTEGAGLVKVFRDRFLLWDGRNLLLRMILFRGWLRHARVMAGGRRRLRRLRLQYWFDRYWEGLEREREEREAFERARADAAAASRAGKTKAAADRRKTRMTRRASAVVFDGAAAHLPGSSFGIISDAQHAGDVALRFLGLASHRAALAKAIAECAEDKGEGEAVTARDVLECLVDCMEEEGIKIGGPTALSEDFAAKIGFFPAFGAEPDAGADAGFSGFLERRTDHMSFLAFGGEADHGPGAAFAAVQSWIEAQRPPFPTQEDLLWLQREFGTGQQKGATCPTSKAPLSAMFHSFRLILGRAVISRNGLEAWALFPERARAAHSR